jgi:hypothetical protein
MSLTKDRNETNEQTTGQHNLKHLKTLINHNETVGHKTGLKLITEANRGIL